MDDEWDEEDEERLSTALTLLTAASPRSDSKPARNACELLSEKVLSAFVLCWRVPAASATLTETLP